MLGLLLLWVLLTSISSQKTKVPAGLEARVAAFVPRGELLEGLVAENVVSGLTTSLVVLMGHGVAVDDYLVKAIPDYTEQQYEQANELARCLQKTVDAQASPVVEEGEE